MLGASRLSFYQYVEPHSRFEACYTNDSLHARSSTKTVRPGFPGMKPPKPSYRQPSPVLGNPT